MTKKIVSSALAVALAIGATPAYADLPANFLVTAEAPGVTNSTATFDYFGVETFDSRAIGPNQSFASDFDNGSGPSPVIGNYSNVNIVGAGLYGGAGGSGNYGVSGISQSNEYSITFSQDGLGINYFGYWLSALDGGNTVEFWSGVDLLGTFNPANVLTHVSGNPAYYGNPFGGGNGNEPYVFLNFFNTTGTFDKIVFKQTVFTAGYESDNHTVGWYETTGGGTPVGNVPEPATWALMILGFGAIGGAMRSRRRQTRTTVAFA